MAESQTEIDRRNAAFWDELCGTTLAERHGITEHTPDGLRRFDAVYLEFYPYLDRYLPGRESQGERVLEVGLGYGTVCQLLASRGLDYHGLDIAQGPVDMARYRLAELGIDDPYGRVRLGSVLDLPHGHQSFDRVVSIGCLHHTGDLPRAVAEVERVLRPGGHALVMLYNRHSYRRMAMAIRRSLGRLGSERADAEEEMRGAYDQNLAGEVAPATVYTSVREARLVFAQFSEVRIRRENFDDVRFRRLTLPRLRLLGWPAHLAGLDLYITAIR